VGWGYATYAVNALARARATRLTKLVHFPRKIKNLLLGELLFRLSDFFKSGAISPYYNIISLLTFFF
jgi:hypothetical protein